VIASVPVLVIGEPLIEKPLGTVAATLVTVPAPAGTAHVPSPLQKVPALAFVPELRFVIGRFPVTSVARFTED
jgi:hypothetical protein